MQKVIDSISLSLYKIKNPWTRWFLIVGFAFASVLSFFSINSYWADQNKINWLLHITGFVFGIIALSAFVAAGQETKRYEREDKEKWNR